MLNFSATRSSQFCCNILRHCKGGSTEVIVCYILKTSNAYMILIYTSSTCVAFVFTATRSPFSVVRDTVRKTTSLAKLPPFQLQSSTISSGFKSHSSGECDILKDPILGHLYFYCFVDHFFAHIVSIHII